MRPASRKRPKIGDVIEIGTKKGLAYAHVIHRHREFGYLLRVLSALHKTRPSSFGQLVEGEEAFLTFFPLGPACSREIVSIVAHAPAPKASQGFPLFRVAGARGRDGQVINWLLWDGDREWRADRPNSELEHLPIRAIWNDTLLVERIEQAWRPHHERVA